MHAKDSASGAWGPSKYAWPLRATSPSTRCATATQPRPHPGLGGATRRDDAIHAQGKHELRMGGPRARRGREARTRGSGSAAVLTGVLPAPQRRSWETGATPSARTLGSIACQRFCIGCLGTVGGSLVTRQRGGWIAPAPRPTARVHLRRSARCPPHRASHSSTGGVKWRDPAIGSRATRSAWAVLGAGLARLPPLSLLSRSNCSHHRRDNVRPTSQSHNASSDQDLIACGPPFPTPTPPGEVSQLSPGAAGNPILVG